MNNQKQFLDLLTTLIIIIYLGITVAWTQDTEQQGLVGVVWVGKLNQAFNRPPTLN